MTATPHCGRSVDPGLARKKGTAAAHVQLAYRHVSRLTCLGRRPWHSIGPAPPRGFDCLCQSMNLGGYAQTKPKHECQREDFDLPEQALEVVKAIAPRPLVTVRNETVDQAAEAAQRREQRTAPPATAATRTRTGASAFGRWQRALHDRADTARVNAASPRPWCAAGLLADPATAPEPVGFFYTSLPRRPASIGQVIVMYILFPRRKSWLSSCLRALPGGGVPST